MALLLQSRLSEVLAVDIHPAAKFGQGVLLDHGTGVVIGETAVVGNGVSIMQVAFLPLRRRCMVLHIPSCCYHPVHAYGHDTTIQAMFWKPLTQSGLCFAECDSGGDRQGGRGSASKDCEQCSYRSRCFHLGEHPGRNRGSGGCRLARPEAS
jgi:hypothetical protein